MFSYPSNYVQVKDKKSTLRPDNSIKSLNEGTFRLGI